MMRSEKIKDTGCDPINMGEKYKMYPSGDIVDYKEMCKRLNKKNFDNRPHNLICGRTQDEIAKMQGIKKLKS